MKTEAAKRAQIKYNNSANGREATRRYRQSPKFKVVRRRWYLKLKAEVFEHYGKMCECCEEFRVEFLELDHINGGGQKHRKQLNNKGGKNFYVWLRTQGWPTGYRVLCSNCNQALGAYGYCPHHKLLDSSSSLV